MRQQMKEQRFTFIKTPSTLRIEICGNSSLDTAEKMFLIHCLHRFFKITGIPCPYSCSLGSRALEGKHSWTKSNLKLQLHEATFHTTEWHKQEAWTSLPRNNVRKLHACIQHTRFNQAIQHKMLCVYRKRRNRDPQLISLTEDTVSSKQKELSLAGEHLSQCCVAVSAKTTQDLPDVIMGKAGQKNNETELRVQAELWHWINSLSLMR